MEAMVHVSFPVPCKVPAPYSKSSINPHYGCISSALQEIGRSEDGSSVAIPPLGFENKMQDKAVVLALADILCHMPRPIMRRCSEKSPKDSVTKTISEAR